MSRSRTLAILVMATLGAATLGASDASAAFRFHGGFSGGFDRSTPTTRPSPDASYQTLNWHPPFQRAPICLSWWHEHCVLWGP
jgi:hypothetical protein